MATIAKKTTTKSRSNDSIQINSVKFGTEIIGTEGDDGIIGTAGNDRIYGKGGNDKIMGGQGNDVIDGGSGDNIILFEVGDGRDTVKRSAGNDTIFLHLNQPNVEFVRDMSTNDLAISYGDHPVGDCLALMENGVVTQYGSNPDNVIVEDFYNNSNVYNTSAENCDADNTHSLKNIRVNNDIYTVKEAMNQFGIKVLGTSSSDSIYTGNGDDIIVAGAGNDVIHAFKGNDIINAGTGSNMIYMQMGDGNKTIINGGGADVLDFYHSYNESAENFKFRFSHDMSNNDLVMNYALPSTNLGETVTLKGYYYNNDHSVKYVRNNYQTKSLTQMLNIYGIDVVGTSGSDSIVGTNGRDVIVAGDGNDIIRGGQGKDTLDGGIGSDTYIFGSNDGQDVIVNNYGYGKDRLIFENLQDTGSISFSKDSQTNDLKISYGYYNNNSVSLQDYFQYNTHAVKNIMINNQYYDVKNLLNEKGLTVNGSSGNDDYYFRLDKNIVINEAGGTDSVRVASANEAACQDLRIMFNVDSTYSLSDGLNFGDVVLLASDEIQNWASGAAFNGVVVKDNAIETVRVWNQQMSSSDVAQLAADVAGWLNTNGYASVQDVFDSNDTTDINSMMAVFQNNANWQPA